MGTKKVVTILLSIFVVISVAFLIRGESVKRSEAVDPATNKAIAEDKDAATTGSAIEDPTQGDSHAVIAYYFRTTNRCSSCLKIEAYSQEAVQNGFRDDIEDGRLKWRVINVEEPGNEHFIQDYQLFTKSVVIVDMKDGKQARWKNLEKVWELLGDKDAFISYVQSGVREYLKEG